MSLKIPSYLIPVFSTASKLNEPRSFRSLSSSSLNRGRSGLGEGVRFEAVTEVAGSELN